jgi:hypothetical protein
VILTDIGVEGIDYSFQKLEENLEENNILKEESEGVVYANEM